MNSIIHADIFFFIATIALVIISLAFLALIIVGIYLIQETRSVVKMLSERADQAWTDLKDFEERLMSKFGLLKILKKIIGRFMD